jgi:predicted  nucleic acid-binding Zn-ribbon protein
MSNVFKTPLTPISWGELIDKITILEIKMLKITSPEATVNISTELRYLQQIVFDSNGLSELISDLKSQLSEVNQQLWQVEDDIRDKESRKEFDQIFIELARMVYQLNDKRSKLKKEINLRLNSEIHEVKSYKDF